MKTLKISFLQSTPDFGREGMLQLLKSRYHVVEDDSYFDYLVATPWFYVNREAFYDFLERAPGHITVMYGCHEAIAPDFMLFDYYIGLDTVPGSDRTVKLPYLRHHLQEVHGGKEGLDAMLSWPPKRVSATSFTPTANPIPTGMPCSTSSPLSGSSIPWGPILTTPRRRPPGGRLVRILHQNEKAV